MHQESRGAWHTKLPGLPWNEHNKEKAKQLLQEAGYKGEPIRFMATQEYKWMYDFAARHRSSSSRTSGFNIDLQVVDWATLVKRRNNPKEYDAFTTGIGCAQFDPTYSNDPDLQLAGLDLRRGDPRPSGAGARDRPQEAAARSGSSRHGSYEKVPSIRYGDLFGLRAPPEGVKGFNESTERPRFYNVWLER